MLEIRQEQIDRLSEVASKNFQDRMLAHIDKHFPTHSKALGEENCRELIRHGIERAATHGFVSERDVCKFIDLMICFGDEFDVDIQLTWGTEILADNSWINAGTKMDALFKAGIRHLKNNPC